MSIRDGLIDLGIHLRNWSVGTHKSVCPQCSPQRKKSKDPCLSVTIQQDRALLKCHHCGWSSSVFENPSERSGDARGRGGTQGPGSSERAQRPTVRPSFTPNSATLSRGAVAWFSRRGISQSTLVKNGVTLKRVWFPQTQDERLAMAFPYRRGGEVINVKYRARDGANNDGDKIFRQEKDAERIFHGLDDLDVLGEDLGDVIIVEGEMDKLALNEIGLWNVLSFPEGAPEKVIEDGDPSNPEKDVPKFACVWNCREYFERADRVILAGDDDQAGRALTYELARRIGRAKCWTVKWPSLNDVQCKDANQCLVEHGQQVLHECIEAAEPLPIKSLFAANYFAEEVWRFYRGEVGRGESTGWESLDELFRVRPGDLSVVTGFPSGGKSEFCDALLMNLAKNLGWKFSLCSFENPPMEHISKLAQKHVGLPFHEGPAMRMGEHELQEAIDWISEHFYFVQAVDEAPTIDWILDTVQAAVMRYGINGFIIDPWNKIEHRRQSGMNETEYVAYCLNRVKNFALMTDTHCWFVAHPGKPQRAKDAAGKPPQAPNLYDISGSAHWTNIADIGISVHRPWNMDDGTLSSNAEIHVKKVRWKWVGEPGIRVLSYSSYTGRYT